MIEIRFTPDDLGRVHFAFSPLWETVMSVRALAGGTASGLHEAWLRHVGPRLRGVDLDLLTTVIRPAGYLPDFLVPSPRRRSPSFEASLAQLGDADPDAVAAQLRHLAGHAVAQRGAGRAGREALLGELAAAPRVAVRRIAASLEEYWKVALAPHWPRIRALLQDDLAHRLDELAGGGVRQLFRTLHPLVRFSGDTLRITKYYNGRADLRGRGLLLVPCAFAWPDVLVLTAEPYTPTVTYSPRGVGRLWETAAVAGESPLAALIGRTRAALLAQLDLPMSTTQLARQFDLSAPTLNVHLKTLAAAGTVSARRDGRSVLYQRTELGERLVERGLRSS